MTYIYALLTLLVKRKWFSSRRISFHDQVFHSPDLHSYLFIGTIDKLEFYHWPSARLRGKAYHTISQKSMYNLDHKYLINNFILTSWSCQRWQSLKQYHYWVRPWNEPEIFSLLRRTMYLCSEVIGCLWENEKSPLKLLNGRFLPHDFGGQIQTNFPRSS